MLFTIITINLNNKFGLEKTFKSVQNQNFKDFEYIVIDGLSTDGSASFIQQSTFITNYLIESDRGVYDAMNKGLNLAKGEYCIFLNSGDSLIDDTVLVEVAKKVDSKSDLYYGCLLWEDQMLPRWNPKRDFKLRNILRHSPTPHQATFYKTSALKEIGGYKSEYKIISDWGTLIDFIRAKKKIEKINIDISICELAGISNVNEMKILNERKHFLLKYHFSQFLMFLIVPSILRLKKILSVN